MLVFSYFLINKAAVQGADDNIQNHADANGYVDDEGKNCFW